MNIRESPRPVILIVEDIDWIRSGMRRAVERNGYAVTEAASDHEAIIIAESLQPAMILTEEDVPTFEALLRRIREHPTLKDVPVVIVNPDAEENTRLSDAYVLTDFEQLDCVLLRPGKTPQKN